jgi:hypothetical protein
MAKERGRMWIMIGGPNGTGARSAAERAANLARMNEAALAVWHKGHVPIIGVNLALPTRNKVYFPSPLAGEGCGALASASELRRSWMRGSAPTGVRARRSATF